MDNQEQLQLLGFFTAVAVILLVVYLITDNKSKLLAILSLCSSTIVLFCTLGLFVSASHEKNRLNGNGVLDQYIKYD